MHPAIENFLDRPLSHKIIFWLVSLSFIFFIFYSWTYSSQLEALDNVTQERDKLDSKVTIESRLAKNLKKFRGEVKALDVKLKFALQELPDKREIPELLSSISNLARDAGLEVSLFKPKEEGYREFYAEVPVQISVRGSYHQVATFFDEVGRLPRIVNIDQIVVAEPDVTDTKVRIRSDCVATTFRYLDENERLQGDTQQGDKRKRRT